MTMLEIAREAARAAQELLANAQPKAITSKANPRDLVTEWDVRSEAAIREVLRRHTSYPIVGEEGGVDGGDGGATRWIVDPIDGTVNFSHGLPLWTIAIAGERDGETVCGVIAVPRMGWWFECERGKGATCNGEPIHVSAIAAIERALLVSGFPYDRATNPDNNFAEWEAVQRRAGACRRLGCASLDLAFVARGNLDGYWERNLKVWDIAAGALLVAESG